MRNWTTLSPGLNAEKITHYGFRTTQQASRIPLHARIYTLMLQDTKVLCAPTGYGQWLRPASASRLQADGTWQPLILSRPAHLLPTRQHQARPIPSLGAPLRSRLLYRQFVRVHLSRGRSCQATRGSAGAYANAQYPCRAAPVGARRSAPYSN